VALTDEQDLSLDITTDPQFYRNYVGAAVRVQVYWTTPIWNDVGKKQMSFSQLKYTSMMLKKHTLGLDTGFPEIRDPWRLDEYLTYPFKLLRSLPRGGLVNWDGAFYGDLAGKGGLPKDRVTDLRNALERDHPRVTQEPDRLVVVFVPFSGAEGYTVLEPEWLPWVLADPGSSPKRLSTMVHEMGHACRLGHQDDKSMIMVDDGYDAQGHAQKKAIYSRNIMSWNDFTNQFYPWQVNSIYESYWCAAINGAPKDWWTMHWLDNSQGYNSRGWN
jgi:hypothetical protein